MKTPKGWQLVPVELTEAQEVAGIFAASQMDNVGLEQLKEKRKAVYRAQLAAAPIPPAQEADQELMQVIAERDQYHEWADKLADAIAERFGVDIGEHSNLNSPWSNALEAIEAPAQEAEPVAWVNDSTLISERIDAERGLHWALRDQHTWRGIKTDYHNTPLYTRPQSDKLRQAAEEVIQAFQKHVTHSPISYGLIRAVARLEEVVEGKS
jgi:hypothetical protein